MNKIFFKIKQTPEAWARMQNMYDSVVTRHPWRHTFLKYGDILVIGRRAWGARHPVWRNEVVYYNTARRPLRSILNTIVIHHTNNSGSIFYNENKQTSKGYAALGYHFYISKEGQVYEGRPLEVMGSHAGRGLITGPLNDPDWGAIGIVLQGDLHHKDDWFSHTNASKKQLLIMEKLIIHLKCKYCINRLLMHREVIRAGKPTVCPGDHMVPIIKKLRARIGMTGK